jgi:hypothetical protein
MMPLPDAASNNSAVVVIVETAKQALEKMTQFIELGCSDVATKGF